MKTQERVPVLEGQITDKRGNAYPLRVSMEEANDFEDRVIFTCTIGHEGEYQLRLCYNDDLRWEDQNKSVTTWSEQIDELIENRLL